MWKCNCAASDSPETHKKDLFLEFCNESKGKTIINQCFVGFHSTRTHRKYSSLNYFVVRPRYLPFSSKKYNSHVAGASKGYLGHLIPFWETAWVSCFRWEEKNRLFFHGSLFTMMMGFLQCLFYNILVGQSIKSQATMISSIKLEYLHWSIIPSSNSSIFSHHSFLVSSQFMGIGRVSHVKAVFVSVFLLYAITRQLQSWNIRSHEYING